MKLFKKTILPIIFFAITFGCSEKKEPEIFTSKLPSIDASGISPKDTTESDTSDSNQPTVEDISKDSASESDSGPEDDSLLEDTQNSDTSDVEPDAGSKPDDFTTCDAGDEAWAKRTIQLLLGRKPTGIREVHVVVDLIKQVGREAVARGLMRTEDFDSRWTDWLMDEVRINRIGDKIHSSCYGTAKLKNDNGQLAAFVRDNPPYKKGPGYNFNMSDLLQSSLKLDDISPFYLGHLFAMMAKPITGANVGALEMDITRRQDFGEIFEATYLHRNVVCVGCHSSAFGVTDNAKPELDLHWPLPGNFEKAVYGKSTGIPEMTLYSIFRHLNIVRESGGLSPWGMDDSCGRFTESTKISPDPAGYDSYFISDLGKSGSVWDTEAALRTGFDQLRTEVLGVDPDTGTVNGYKAFAYMVSARITNQVWREAMGYGLTLVHYFPRNPAQRDILLELTNSFVASQWSIRTLLTNIVTHDLYNENSPKDGCGPDTPYHLAMVFNPWSTSAEDELEKANSVGDSVHRASARVLLNSTTAAMYWPKPAGYPEGGDVGFQKAVGLFMKDGEPGFSGVDFQGLLSWENRYGKCENQSSGNTNSNESSCVDKCGSDYDANAACQCDDDCSNFGDCCGDYDVVCKGEEPSTEDESAGTDWFGDLASAISKYGIANPDGPPITVADAVSALKDRLITEPDILPGKEAALVAALMGIDSLQVPISEVNEWPVRLRGVCGALLQTPQFMLVGIPAADQLSKPVLVVGATSYKARCKALAPLVIDETEWTVECSDTSFSLAPANDNDQKPQ